MENNKPIKGIEIQKRLKELGYGPYDHTGSGFMIERNATMHSFTDFEVEKGGEQAWDNVCNVLKIPTTI